MTIAHPLRSRASRRGDLTGRRSTCTFSFRRLRRRRGGAPRLRDKADPVERSALPQRINAEADRREDSDKQHAVTYEFAHSVPPCVTFPSGRRGARGAAETVALPAIGTSSDSFPAGGGSSRS